MGFDRLIDAVETAVAPAAGGAKFRSVGLEGAIAYYNSPETVEGDWFAFIADCSGTIVDHYHKEKVGRHLRDIFGTDVIEATAEGNWVTTEDVRVWVVSYDGMTFGSGWHRGHRMQVAAASKSAPGIPAAGDPLILRYDADGNMMIDKSEVLTAEPVPKVM